MKSKEEQATYDRLFRSLYRIRRVEEEIVKVYPTDKIKSPVHLSIGQEAANVGVCEALQHGDVVFGTYRGHALYLAKGGNLKKMIAELYGKVTGCARGKGGSMHLVDPEAGVMGTSAVVATTIPQAVGYAYALKLKGNDNIVASFFGDGAVEEGVFHESLNFASLKNLPILFVCENNFYAIHTHQSRRQSLDNICEKARVYGIPSERIGDGDVLRIYEKAKDVASQIRDNGSGPWLLECLAYRWKEHVGPNDDFDAGLRPRSEAEPWFERDPVQMVGRALEPNLRQELEAEVETEIKEAFQYAEDSPFPPDEELYSHVFKEPEWNGF